MADSVGEQLRQRREERSISLEQVALTTHIRLRYLQAIEAGDYAALPSPAQARGFVRAFASYLNLDPEPLMVAFNEQFPHLTGSPREPTLPLPETVGVEASQTDFILVGQRLRSQREMLGLSREDVERHTHLRSHYLKALEDGSLKDLPSPVQGRGMLKNYADFLGLDAEPLLLQYASGLQAGLAARQTTIQKEQQAARKGSKAAEYPKPARGQAVARTGALSRIFSIDLLATALVVVFIGAFVVWGVLRITHIQADRAASTATPTARSVADVLLSGLTGTPTVSTTSEEPLITPSPGLQAVVVNTPLGDPFTPEAIETQAEDSAFSLTSTPPTPGSLPPLGNSAIQVYVIIRQRAWMRITVDGEVEFDGRVIPGGAYSFEGDERIELLTGNGAGLQVFYNQTDLGQLGLFGQVISLVFNRDGMLVPTPSVTPTSAPTQTPETTPTGTPTGAAATPLTIPTTGP